MGCDKAIYLPTTKKSESTRTSMAIPKSRETTYEAVEWLLALPSLEQET